MKRLSIIIILLISIIISLIIGGCGTNIEAYAPLQSADLAVPAAAAGNGNFSESQNAPATAAATTALQTTTAPPTDPDSTKDIPTRSQPLSASKITRDLTIHFLDVGQSDCTIIELPNGETMMIDAGGSDSEKRVIEYINTLGIKYIDYIFGTHPHEDHIGSLDAVIYNYGIGRIFMPKITHNTKTFENVISAISKKGLKIESPAAGELLINDNNSHLYIRALAPGKDEYVNLNNYSIVLKLAYIDVSFLFMGDAEDIIEYEMIDAGLNLGVDLLKTGHHGSDTSTSGALIAAASPKYAVISVGNNNSYGHPSKSVIDGLTASGVEIFRTDELGTIIVSTNGKEINISHEKFKEADATAAAAAVTASTTDPAAAAAAPDDNNDIKTDGDRYIGNKNSLIFHNAYCSSLPKESNRTYFESREAAENAGYRACKNCKP
jgi:competence protein ComEC